MIVPHGLIEALLATASDAIVATDHTGIVNFWNPGAVRIFGFTADEAIGRSLDLIIPDNLRARHWTGFNRVMETGVSRYGHGDSSRSQRWPRAADVSQSNLRSLC
jgi:PAS domain S-box-containing protein